MPTYKGEELVSNFIPLWCTAHPVTQLDRLINQRVERSVRNIRRFSRYDRRQGIDRSVVIGCSGRAECVQETQNKLRLSLPASNGLQLPTEPSANGLLFRDPARPG